MNSVKRIIMMLCLNFLFFGCKKDNLESGNLIDKTNPDAPKQIISNEITYFYLDFYHFNCATQNDSHEFTFEITTNEQGIVMAYEKHTNIQFEADGELLTNLHTIIQEHQLVQNNGIYLLRTGVDPKYQKCELHVMYRSNETLDYTTNNDPNALWTKQIYTLFNEWFLSKGIVDLSSKK
ncbi:MAG: hypothetical protein IKY26_10080 [Erysipelotrichaceae bacterium]|nr:hypothetical protein [Erysipelotrichaceae bacterium]